MLYIVIIHVTVWTMGDKVKHNVCSISTNLFKTLFSYQMPFEIKLLIYMKHCNTDELPRFLLNKEEEKRKANPPESPQEADTQQKKPT